MSSSTIPETHQSEAVTEPGNQIINPGQETGSSGPATDPRSGETGGSSEEKVIVSKGNSDESKKDEEEEEEEEEEGECGFCVFMKGGGCKETFVEWEKCVEEGEKNNEDIVEKCFQVTSYLKKCMEAHSDYYAPLLQAEKAAEQEAAKQLEEEKANETQKEGNVDEPKKDEVSEQKIEPSRHES